MKLYVLCSYGDGLNDPDVSTDYQELYEKMAKSFRMTLDHVSQGTAYRRPPAETSGHGTRYRARYWSAFPRQKKNRKIPIQKRKCILSRLIFGRLISSNRTLKTRNFLFPYWIGTYFLL